MQKSDQSTNTLNTSKPISGIIDWFIFCVSSLLLLFIIIMIISFPESSATVIDELYLSITAGAGVLYVLAAICVLSFLLCLAFSRYGSIVFGEVAQPTYPFFSWCSMLFCAGIGASLIYWGATEWVLYYIEPPFGLEARSDEAIRWAAAY